MDSVHHIWCPLSSQEYQDLPDGAETTLTIVSAAMADEATAIMATNDTRIFFMVGSPVFSYPNNQRLITEKAFDLRAGYSSLQEPGDCVITLLLIYV